ncbi:GGDEF domain-containing protein [Pelotomaculum propionicicum]|uniref:Response regulator PleD n=1 Tax=Pelotomaculum propionicicum TaxID=258475 RepID=A0A4Y7RT55_9FIRM|nr:GGDEF domain-containing protein [Pelotomaculum propionicicum]TEB11909.1 Response regulator PleD [Pelotomaculum propionicicum]
MVDYECHVVEILCKGSRGIIYLAVLVWMIWFNWTHHPNLKKTKWLIFTGIPISLLGFIISLYGESCHLPVFVKEVIGEIILSNIGIALILGCLISLVTEISRISRRHKQEAETDPLTGLYNRRAFVLEADRILKNARDGDGTPSVAILDIDNMKQINDSRGHQYGDEILKKVALVIKNSIRAWDVAVRYGGDEFAVLFPDKGPEKEVLKTRLANNLAGISGETENLNLTLSLGLGQFPVDGRNLDELLSIADARMYEEKKEKGYKD